MNQDKNKPKVVLKGKALNLSIDCMEDLLYYVNPSLGPEYYDIINDLVESPDSFIRGEIARELEDIPNKALKKLVMDPVYDIRRTILTREELVPRLSAEELIKAANDQPILVNGIFTSIDVSENHPESDQLIQHYSKHSNPCIRRYTSEFVIATERKESFIKIHYQKRCHFVRKGKILLFSPDRMVGSLYFLDQPLGTEYYDIVNDLVESPDSSIREAVANLEDISSEALRKLVMDPVYAVREQILLRKKFVLQLSAEELIKAANDQPRLVDEIFTSIEILKNHPESHQLVWYYSQHSNPRIQGYTSEFVKESRRLNKIRRKHLLRKPCYE